MKPIIEICIDSAADAAAIVAAGADRLELCVDIACGGLTPSHAEILTALESAPAEGLMILVRNRPQGFRLSADEVNELCEQIRNIRALTSAAPVPVGYVVGAVTAEESASIDLPAAKAFRDAAGDAPLTFHRAFDVVQDQFEALEQLVALGYDRILTTGGAPRVADLDQLRALREAARGRITILISGGIRADNVAAALLATGSGEVHMRAPYADAQGNDPSHVARIMAAVS